MTSRLRARCAFLLLSLIPAASGVADSLSLPASVPKGWKLVTSTAGQCQLAVPEKWQEGRDFWVERTPVAQITFPNGGVLTLPPKGVDEIRGIVATDPQKRGTGEEIRFCRESGGWIYSVYRLAPTPAYHALTHLDYLSRTAENELRQVGSTLKPLP